MKKTFRRIIGLFVFVLFGLLLFACGGKEKIVIRGSTSIEKLMGQIVDAYEKTDKGKNIEFDIVCEGSGKGRSAAENDTKGNVLGMSSAAIKAEDKSKFHEILLAKDAIAVIVNKDNAVQNLTVKEIYDIYTGTTTKFEGIEKNITVVGRDAASGTREAFEDLVKDGDNKLKGKMVKGALELAGTSEVVGKVKTTQSSIGYISLGSLDDSVKAVQVDGVDATVANVNNGTYKMFRPFVLVVNAQLHKDGKITQALKDFIDYINSAAVKEIVQKAKYVPAQ